MRLALVTPASSRSRSGNRHTATRYSAFLRAGGHDVRVAMHWDGARCDGMIALHARRSRPSIAEFRNRYPEAPLIVVLTGTDLYRDIRTDAEARNSLTLADRLIVLQERALDELTPAEAAKTDIVYQSAATRLVHAPIQRRFRIAALGHLRDEKDPFRAMLALAHLPDPDIEVLHVGEAMTDDMRIAAERAMATDQRYRWIGGRSHGATMRLLASSHLLVVSSKMEGGANVICEAGRIGVPVIASDIPGNVGMLGEHYPGYYPLGDSRALAALVRRARDEGAFYQALRRRIKARGPLFAPAAEARGLLKSLRRAARR